MFINNLIRDIDYGSVRGSITKAPGLYESSANCNFNKADNDTSVFSYLNMAVGYPNGAVSCW